MSMENAPQGYKDAQRMPTYTYLAYVVSCGVRRRISIHCPVSKMSCASSRLYPDSEDPLDRTQT